jgi:hypothetical protein
MDVKEASGVCKDRVKWRAICGGRIKGGDRPIIYCLLNAYPVINIMMLV